jgi:type II secretory pathway pseudopilin PulG
MPRRLSASLTDDTAVAPDRDSTRPSVRDSGISFVEVTVAVAILGFAASALFGAMFASSQTSTRNRTIATVERTILDAFDRINRAPMACTYTSEVTAALQAHGLPTNAATIAYQRYAPSNSLATPGQWLTGACQNGVVTAGLVQSITVTVSGAAGSTIVTRSATTVKSRD